MANENLVSAKKNKNDEFYTQLIDIEKELVHYKDHLKGKVIYCNCDSYESKFVKYFNDNFDDLELKGFIHSSCDFRSEESIEMLKQADIVITNPPFSLFREYVAQLIEYDKKFLIIGNQNAITYKEIFPLIKENSMWFGITMNGSNRWFTVPDDYPFRENAAGTKIENGKKMIFVNGVRWFTNLTHQKRNEMLPLYAKQSEKNYPTYDNYDAINIDKVVDIPHDYDGVMGVPITFIDKYNPDQFQIIDCNDIRLHGMRIKKYGLIKDKDSAINGKAVYARIAIKHKLIYDEHGNTINYKIEVS